MSMLTICRLVACGDAGVGNADPGDASTSPPATTGHVTIGDVTTTNTTATAPEPTTGEPTTSTASTASPTQPVRLRALFINVGNASPQFGCFEYELCRPRDVANVSEYIAALQRDVTAPEGAASVHGAEGCKFDHAFVNFGGPLVDALPLGSALGGPDDDPRADGGDELDHRQRLVVLEFTP